MKYRTMLHATGLGSDDLSGSPGSTTTTSSVTLGKLPEQAVSQMLHL